MPVVFLSAAREVEGQGLVLGAVDFIAKPVWVWPCCRGL
jgi:FixJ family two-component response regulator